MDPLWSETCWSTFKYFIILIVSINHILCISWIVKILIVTDARCKYEDNSKVISNVIDCAVKRAVAIQNVCCQLMSFAKVKRQIKIVSLEENANEQVKWPDRCVSSTLSDTFLLSVASFGCHKSKSQLNIFLNCEIYCYWYSFQQLHVLRILYLISQSFLTLESLWLGNFKQTQNRMVFLRHNSISCLSVYLGQLTGGME